MPVFTVLSSWLSSSPRRRSARMTRGRHPRPRPLTLEPLEHRLPPGDLLGGLGWSPFGGILAEDSFVFRPAAQAEKNAPAPDADALMTREYRDGWKL